ncbi:hypothetical protein [Eisenbergiella massiliensis]|uniref:hypothetical protein n=1 Tax=Eisenbergiella massiliensis TaxID=1720294 RepID=UPI0023F30957|nr:hypothetical protein [Eisenbergiella massiliensis]
MLKNKVMDNMFIIKNRNNGTARDASTVMEPFIFCLSGKEVNGDTPLAGLIWGYGNV